MTTISASTTIGVVLTSPSYTNPVAINPGVTVSSSVGGGVGVSASSGSWTIQNGGSIAGNATSTSGAGIDLKAGGSVTNQSGATVSGHRGVIGGTIAAMTVLNAGDIVGNPTSAFDVGISGPLNRGMGVNLNAGGSVSNQNTGTISGYDGVAGYGGALTVVNAGSIAGGPNGGVGVYLQPGGSITNQSSATISGTIAVYAFNGALNVVNAGIIAGVSSGVGIWLEAGGSVTNQSTATISGGYGISGGGGFSDINGGPPSTVVNAGSIAGDTTDASGAGVWLRAGGSVTNQSTAAISGHRGVYGGKYGALTVVNAGTISGTSYAVQFVAGQANRLVLDPGAVFSGTVTGGNTLGATAVSTLELATGDSSGTLSGLGSQFIDFAQIAVDTGASWTLSGVNTIAAGETVTDSGALVVTSSLSNSGSIGGPVTLGAGVVLTNAAGGLISATVTTAVYGSAAGAVAVTNAGTIRSGTFGVLLADGGIIRNVNGSSIYGVTRAIEIDAAAGTVINYGSISAGTIRSAIALKAGGQVTNAAGGFIYNNGGNAVYVEVAAGTVINAGSIASFGTGGFGVMLEDGGLVSNSSTAMIGSAPGGGVDITGAAGTVINAGTITAGGTHSGIDLFKGGFVSNAATGTITSSGGGIYEAGAAGTVVNAGVVQSSLSIAVELTGGTGTVINTGVIKNSGAATHGVVDLLTGGYVGNAGTGTISSINGPAIYVTGETGTVVNAGQLLSSLNTVLGFEDGGSITNQSTGLVSSGKSDLFITGGAGTVINAGTFVVSSGTNAALGLFDGGFVSNAATGTISAIGAPVYFANVAGTVINAGNILSSQGDAVVFKVGGTVTNQSAGTINGNIFVTGGGGTVINAGSIGGTIDAVQFTAGFANRLVIDPGAVFNGAVTGGNAIGAAAVSTLELASGTSVGTLSGIGTQLTNFSAIAFDPGADWFVAGNTSGLAGTISGFALGDTIEVNGITVTGSSFSGGILTLTEASGAATLDLPGTFTTSQFVVTNVSGGAEVSVLCFCVNTQILTPSGERPVQELAVGDLVTTWRGAARPIVWIGVGRVLATRGRRNAATPVVVCKGALADNVPSRDLRVTKGHALWLNGVLIPVEYLVNHRSILWDDLAQEVELYHIELDSHDVLVANSAPAESYRDDGNRWLFRNANTGWGLPPLEPCAPVLTGGAVVDATWRRLLDRAGPRPGVPLTEDPDLHLLVDGQRLDVAERAGEACVFHLPAIPSVLRIMSSAAAPAELGLARDPRVLGVALRRLAVRKGTRFQVTEVNDDRLTDGFHAFEVDNGFRWTDGDAVVPSALFDGFTGAVELVLHIGGTAQYPADGHGQRAA